MHEVTFSGLSLDASPGRVMTPRPATEQLVAAAVNFVRSRPTRVADVGTGTGAIAVAIAEAAPAARVYTTDTSPYAVELARANVERHGLGDRVTVRHGDLLDPVPGPIDLVVPTCLICPPPTPPCIRTSPASRQRQSSRPAMASTRTGVCSPPALSGSTGMRP
jgi:HemK-like putative methylase